MDLMQGKQKNLMREISVRFSGKKQPDEKELSLAETMNNINYRYGRNTVFLTGEGIRGEWNVKQNFLSRRFTTNLKDLLEVK